MSSKLPQAVIKLIEQFERLPGIGPKSAQRIVFYLIHHPEEELARFGRALVELKQQTVLCRECHNVSDQDPCPLCQDAGRDRSQLMVVEQPLDVLALERAESYHGQYHVLHGAISPLNHIGPDQLFLNDVLQRLEGVTEVILATNPTMEGEATALYIKELIEKRAPAGAQPKISRIGHGLPIGADIEYADGVTLARALEGRRDL